MPEQERLTKKERRTRNREERKLKEAEAAKKAKRDRIRNSAVALVIVAVVVSVIVGAFTGGAPRLDEPILVSPAAAEEARAAAGCEMLTERLPLPEAFHFDAPNAPDLNLIYTDTRPTHSGPHLGTFNPVREDGYTRQISEAATTHNLEHGAVIVWYDPAQVDDDTIQAIRDWNQLLNGNGFREAPQGGAGVTSSPYTDPGIASGKAVAYRSWGTAMDCDAWDETVANSFIAEHFGTRGIAPEAGAFAPYPTGVLEFSDEGDPTDGDGEPDADDDPDEE